jgi:hypothetical protein
MPKLCYKFDLLLGKTKVAEFVLMVNPYIYVINNCNTTGFTSGTGTAHAQLSGEPEFTFGF